MKYLLDVNALLALSFIEHQFHRRVATWVRILAEEGTTELATCSITELGLIRIVVRAPQYGFTVPQARSLLRRLKAASTLNFTFIADNHDISHLPDWVSTPKQITDGHLAQLARANGAILATLDRKISGAFLIPTER
ncbi:MAG: VapC toxin family PIN domain ribonuclease [Acidobacteria bacterium]|nr:MAG: VapC toxin family PIN domain ribonuclease [Acidobacteriota bacterium]